MALISRLGVVLGLDSAEFNAGLGKAESALTKMGVKSVAIGNVVQDLAYKILGAVPAALQFADQMNDLAKANEVAVGTVLNLSKALKLNGGESENAGKLLASFTNKIDEAAGGSKKAQESFDSINVTLKDLSTLSGQALFEKTVAGLAKIEDPVRRNALAAELMGKALRGVDVKGFADTLENNKDDFSKSEKAFKDIGNAMDRLDEFTQKASVSLATIFAPALTSSVNVLDDLVFGWSKLERNVHKANEELRKNREWQPKATIKDKPQAGMFNLPSEYTAEAAAVREVTDAKAKEAADKAKSAAEALARKIESQTDSLSQQVKQYKLQTEEIGEQKSEYEKLNLEFEKGGKYFEVKNQKLKDEALFAAYNLDAEKKRAEINKINYDIDVARAIELGNLYEQGRQITEDIKKRKLEQDESVKAEVYALEVQKQRLDFEKQMAGLSDTQVQKALQLFDLSKEALALYKEGELTDQQIASLIEAKSAVIMAEEENKRAQNTFQAGWDKAYNNFIEKAKDSSVIGAEAFSSMANSMTSALDRFVESGKLSFSGLIKSMIQDLIKFMVKAQAAKLFGAIGDIFGSFGGGADLSPSASYGGIIGMKATGGSVYGDTPYIVGERGAELFVPKNSGTIIPNNQLSSALSSPAQTVYNAPVIQNMSAIDTQSALQFLQRNKEGVWAATQSAQRSLPMQRGS